MIQPFEHKDRGGVAGLVADRRTGDFDGADHRGVGGARGDRPRGQCHDVRLGPGADGVAGSGQTELGADPIGGHVRQEADHLRALEPGGAALAQSRGVPDDLRIAVGRDHQLRTPHGQVHAVRRLACRLEHQDLPRERRPQIGWRKAQPVQRDVERVAGPCRRGSGEQGVDELTRASGVRRSHAHAHHGDPVLCGAGTSAGAGSAESREFRGVDHDVGVVAAEAERAHRGAARAVPGLVLPWQPEGPRAAQPGEWVVDGLAYQGPGSVFHRRQDLEESDGAGRRHRVAHVRLDRADREIPGPREDLCRGADLRGVPADRPRGVAFEEGDGLRPDVRRGVRRAHRTHLSGLVGDEQSLAATVVAHPDPPDHAQHTHVAPDRVLEPHQRDQCRALGGDQAVRLAVQRARPAAAAERRESGEARLDQQWIRAADPAGQHQVGGALVQAVAGELQRVQGGRARRVERERPGTQAEHLRTDVGR